MRGRARGAGFGAVDPERDGHRVGFVSPRAKPRGRRALLPEAQRATLSSEPVGDSRSEHEHASLHQRRSSGELGGRHGVWPGRKHLPDEQHAGFQQHLHSEHGDQGHLRSDQQDADLVDPGADSTVSGRQSDLQSSDERDPGEQGRPVGFGQHRRAHRSRRSADRRRDISRASGGWTDDGPPAFADREFGIAPAQRPGATARAGLRLLRRIAEHLQPGFRPERRFIRDGKRAGSRHARGDQLATGGPSLRVSLEDGDRRQSPAVFRVRPQPGQTSELELFGGKSGNLQK